MKEFSSLTFCKCLSQFEGTFLFRFRTVRYGWWFEFPILEVCGDALWSWNGFKNFFEFHKATWVIVSSFFLLYSLLGGCWGPLFFLEFLFSFCSQDSTSDIGQLQIVLDLDETLICAYETSTLPAIIRSQAIEAGLKSFELECFSSDKVVSFFSNLVIFCFSEF